MRKLTINMFATVGDHRGRVVNIDNTAKNNITTVDLSTPEGLLVGIPVKSLN